jgi:CubicO group peptidase (beta-lactamase class C family)
MTEDKDRITLRHLLTMSAGLEWDESGDLLSPDNDLYQIWRVPDPIGFVLGKPLVAAPGTVWNYSGGWTNVLGQVIRRATGARVYDFADAALFGPLGITRRSWETLPNDIEYVSGDLRITPRAMAKIGLLYLDRGQWQGRQVVSERWTEEATRRHVTDAATIRRWHSTGDGYGCQWWNITFAGPSGGFDAFFSSGWGGQQIIVIRELNMVIVFTGANYTVLPNRWIQQMVEENILTAVS